MSDHDAGNLWRFGAAELDERSGELRIGGVLVEIEPKPFDVLLLLLKHAGEVVTNDELLEAVWPGRIVNDSAVANTVSKIRKVLKDDDQQIIKTLPRAGYKLVAMVEYVASRRAPAALPQLEAGATVPGREQWRLVERLGSGGYGDAWLAEHEKTHEKRVFKFCVDDSAHLSALKREVTLYRLLHSALGERDDYVRILEWNFEQAPYFIESEFAGQNLRTWAEHNGRLASIALPQRIELIARIADALAAAHSVGVLHKDLKPENVLVAEGSDATAIRLADFGAARLIDAGKLGEFGITQLGFTQTIAGDSTSGTLIYMAPELVRGGVPSVQSDVYSLGVMLYQIAAGELGKPMASGWEAEVADELLRQDIAAATSGNRERRLPSAQLLAERLRSLPARRVELDRLRADQQRAAEVQKKLEQARAKLPWLLALVVVLLAGIGASVHYYLSEREQTRVAKALGDFVTNDILQASNPTTTTDGAYAITLKDAIIKSIPSIQKRFGNDRLSEASIDKTIGGTLYALSDYKDALPLFQRTVVLQTELYGANDKKTLSTEVQELAVLIESGLFQEARQLLANTLPQIKQIPPNPSDPYDADWTIARAYEAEIPLREGSPGEAVPVFEHLVADAQAEGADESLVAELQTDYANALTGDQQFAKADPLLRQVLAAYEKKHGLDDEDTLTLLQAQAFVEVREGRLNEAGVDIETARAGFAKLDGPDSLQVAGVIELEAELDGRQGRWADAASQYGKASALESTTPGTSRTQAMMLLAGHAWALDRQGRFQDALPLAQEAVAASSKNRSHSSQPYVYSRYVLAQLLLDLNRAAEARPLFNDIQAAFAGAYGNSAEHRGLLLFQQAELDKAESAVPKARDDAAQSVKLLQKGVGADDPETRDAKALLQLLPTL